LVVVCWTGVPSGTQKRVTFLCSCINHLSFVHVLIKAKGEMEVASQKR